jgi:hypothetical protein
MRMPVAPGALLGESADRKTSGGIGRLVSKPRLCKMAIGRGCQAAAASLGRAVGRPVAATADAPTP